MPGNWHPWLKAIIRFWELKSSWLSYITLKIPYIVVFVATQQRMPSHSLVTMSPKEKFILLYHKFGPSLTTQTMRTYHPFVLCIAKKGWNFLLSSKLLFIVHLSISSRPPVSDKEHRMQFSIAACYPPNMTFSSDWAFHSTIITCTELRVKKKSFF
jgi:hypothetical protein